MKTITDLLEIQMFLEEFLITKNINPNYFLFDKNLGLTLDKFDYYWKETEDGYICENFYISKKQLNELQKEFLEEIKKTLRA